MENKNNRSLMEQSDQVEKKENGLDKERVTRRAKLLKSSLRRQKNKSGLIAQSVERGANNAKVVGSIPTGTTFFRLVQLSQIFLENAYHEQTTMRSLREEVQYAGPRRQTQVAKSLQLFLFQQGSPSCTSTDSAALSAQRIVYLLLKDSQSSLLRNWHKSCIMTIRRCLHPG